MSEFDLSAEVAKATAAHPAASTFTASYVQMQRLEDDIKLCIKKHGIENVLAAFVNATDGHEHGEAVNELYRRLFKEDRRE